MCKALLISGGGSWGSYGVAKAEQLYHNDYDLVMGWSTGALIAPLAAIGEFQLLKQMYFNTNQADVFNVNPFNKNGGISIWNAVKRTIQQKPTLGETLALKNLIDTYYTWEHFDLLRRKGKEVIIAASWLRSKSLAVKYFSSKRVSFEVFKLAMWASASPLFYGSIVEIAGEQYTDAGAVELIGFHKAELEGATEIDAIVHRTQRLADMDYITTVTRWWDFLGRVSPAIQNETVMDDVYKGVLYASAKGIKTTVHYMSKHPGFPSMMFDSKKMTDLYYQY